MAAEMPARRPPTGGAGGFNEAAANGRGNGAAVVWPRRGRRRFNEAAANGRGNSPAPSSRAISCDPLQ